MGENTDRVLHLAGLFNSRAEAPEELLDPEVEWVNAAEAVEPGVRRGIPAFREAIARIWEVFGVAESAFERIEERGDRVAAVMLVEFAIGATERFGVLWTLREGRLLRYEWFTDPDEPFRRLDA